MAKEIFEILKQLAAYTVFAVGVALFYTWPGANLKSVAAAFITTVALTTCAGVCTYAKAKV